MPAQTYTDNSRGKVVNVISKRTIRHAHNPNALKTADFGPYSSQSFAEDVLTKAVKINEIY
jgi:hypothetical protein